MPPGPVLGTMALVRSFDELVSEAESADVSGWDFGWLEGRATEQRPQWGYARLLAERLGALPPGKAALDLDTGGGEVLREVLRQVIEGSPLPPGRLTVTEGWAPNAERARQSLGSQGVEVVECDSTARLPFVDARFDLVTSRHPVAPNWAEIARVLVDDGTYFAQHVGPASAFELIEYFLGPLPAQRRGRHPDDEVAAAERAGLEIADLRMARCRMEFRDVGAVVWTLRKCVWWVPDFSVTRYEPELRALDSQLRQGDPFVAHSTRHLIEVRRRAR